MTPSDSEGCRKKDEALERARRWAQNRGYDGVAEDLARALSLAPAKQQYPDEGAEPMICPYHDDCPPGKECAPAKPCACVPCACPDAWERCGGCGAKMCDEHAPNKINERREPAKPCEGCRKALEEIYARTTDGLAKVIAKEALSPAPAKHGADCVCADGIVGGCIRLEDEPAKPCAEVTLTEEERHDLEIISRPNSGPVQNRMAALIKRLLGQGEKK